MQAAAACGGGGGRLSGKGAVGSASPAAVDLHAPCHGRRRPCAAGQSDVGPAAFEKSPTKLATVGNFCRCCFSSDFSRQNTNRWRALAVQFGAATVSSAEADYSFCLCVWVAVRRGVGWGKEKEKGEGEGEGGEGRKGEGEAARDLRKVKGEKSAYIEVQCVSVCSVYVCGERGRREREREEMERRMRREHKEEKERLALKAQRGKRRKESEKQVRHRVCVRACVCVCGKERTERREDKEGSEEENCNVLRPPLTHSLPLTHKRTHDTNTRAHTSYSPSVAICLLLIPPLLPAPLPAASLTPCSPQHARYRRTQAPWPPRWRQREGWSRQSRRLRLAISTFRTRRRTRRRRRLRTSTRPCCLALDPRPAPASRGVRTNATVSLALRTCGQRMGNKQKKKKEHRTRLRVLSHRLQPRLCCALTFFSPSSSFVAQLRAARGWLRRRWRRDGPCVLYPGAFPRPRPLRPLSCSYSPYLSLSLVPSCPRQTALHASRGNDDNGDEEEGGGAAAPAGVDAEAGADGKAEEGSKPSAKRKSARSGPTLDADRLLGLERGIPKLQKMMKTIRFHKSKGSEVRTPLARDGEGLLPGAPWRRHADPHFFLSFPDAKSARAPHGLRGLVGPDFAVKVDPEQH